MVIGTCQLSLQAGHFLFQFVDHAHLGVLVLRRDVRDEAGLRGIVQGRYVLLEEAVRRRQARDHECVGVATERLLEEACELGVAIRDMRQRSLVLASARLREPGDDFAEGEEALVDVDRLLLGESGRSRLACPLTARQVHQLQLGDDLIIHRGIVRDLESERENAVRPTRCMVEIVRGDDLVLDAFVVVLHALLCILALEDIEVLDGELIILVPPYPESFLVLVLELLRGVEEVEYLLVVDLQEGAGDGDVLLFLGVVGPREGISNGSYG